METSYNFSPGTMARSFNPLNSRPLEADDETSWRIFEAAAAALLKKWQPVQLAVENRVRLYLLLLTFTLLLGNTGSLLSVGYD